MNSSKVDYRLLSHLVVYFHDIKHLKLANLKVSPLEVLKESFSGINIEEGLLTPEAVTKQERGAMVALDLVYEVYKQEMSKKNLTASQEDFKARWLLEPEARKAYEAAIASVLSRLPDSVSLGDLQKV